MSNFDNFMNKARDVAGAAAHKTGEVVELSKLKLQSVKLGNTIQKAYEELGSAYYNSAKFNASTPEQLNACVEKLDQLLKEQDDLNQQIKAAGKPHSLFCATCGYENAAGASFCSRCGSPMSSGVVGVSVESHEV